jgi:hypothetical protein
LDTVLREEQDMKRFTTTWTAAVTAAALLMLPATGAAQTPPPSQPPSTQAPATTQQQPTAVQTAAAREHLVKAKTALDEIDVATLNAKTKTQVGELKRRVNALERSVASNDEASATGTAKRDPRATAGAKGAVNWGTEVAAIDKTLTAMLGPATTTGAPPAATGTAGSTGKAGDITLDATTRAKLTDLRTHITAFATAMAGGATKKESTTEPSSDPNAAAASDPSAAAATAPPASATSAPPASATPPATNPASTAGAPTDPAQTPAAAQAAQPDEQAARRHLTEARNTLSALTQLPAASQLSGEARTQVSQLISNFNELITTQNEWRGSYAKVSATLTALLGPETATPEPTGTAGAVGTSGTTTAALDPTVREKLVELRRQLSEFEKAAGGGAAAAAGTTPPANPATPDPTAPPSATPPSATPPSATPPSSTPPSTTPPSATPPSSTTPPETAPAGQATGSNADIMRHVAAIEALLKMEDESGGLTLTKAQVEQLRSHWSLLKQALDKR